MSRAKCRNRHVSSTDWESFYVETQTFHVHRRAGVRVEKQYRYKYPAGGDSACCEFRRTVLVPFGPVLSERAAKQVAGLLQRLGPLAVSEYRL